MSNQGIARPSLARKHTRASGEKRDKALDTGVRVTVDGDVFEVRVGDVTPALARELRALTGGSFMRLLATVADDPDVDVLTTFEWLARRVRGEDVTLDQVEFTYDDIASDAFDVEEMSDPEAIEETIDGEQILDPKI